MMIEIHDDINVDEYNKLRVEAGWEIKNPLIVEKAIRNSTIIKRRHTIAKQSVWPEPLGMVCHIF